MERPTQTLSDRVGELIERYDVGWWSDEEFMTMCLPGRALPKEGE